VGWQDELERLNVGNVIWSATSPAPCVDLFRLLLIKPGDFVLGVKPQRYRTEEYRPAGIGRSIRGIP